MISVFIEQAIREAVILSVLLLEAEGKAQRPLVDPALRTCGHPAGPGACALD
jgi:3-hydroxyacyl-CoA dehydrogenase